MRQIFFLLACLFLLTTESFAQQDLDNTIMIGGIQRQYMIHLPSTFDTTKLYPVIFAFHGGGGNYKQTIPFYNFDKIADAKGFIIVYPNAINKAWNMPGISSRVKNMDSTVDDVHFISILMDLLRNYYNADPKRIFCTGISRGGMFSLYLADKLSYRIAGVAPVCASISKTITSDYVFEHPTPVLLINGTSDPLVKYNGGIGEFNKANEGNDDANMLPTEDLVRKIVILNHCDTVPVTHDLPNNNTSDGCTETESIYSCDNNVTLDFIKIVNGGHTWPGGSQYLPKLFIGRVCRDFSAAEKIIDFFGAIK